MLGKMATRLRETLNVYARPSHLRAVLHDKRGRGYPIVEDAEHLGAAMAWLCRAQDATGCGGVAARYSLKNGWHAAYPETTGYIICTFLDYADLTGQDEYRDRAVRMGQWEADIQLPDGGVRAATGLSDYPDVFNTGQVILGWAALHRRTGRQRFGEALARAADWLVSVQDDDGAWRRDSYGGMAHAYHSRISWAMLEASELTGEARYGLAAEENVHWTLAVAGDDGWVDNMGFQADGPVYTHTIAYTVRGLLECGRLLEGKLKDRALTAALRAAERLMRVFELNKVSAYAPPRPMPGAFSGNWTKPDKSFSCLTGNAQLAIIWLKVARSLDDLRYLNAALKIIDQVKATQCLTCRHGGIRGAIPGSQPMWGPYIGLDFPNWAAKFFADAVMLQETSMAEAQERLG